MFSLRMLLYFCLIFCQFQQHSEMHLKILQASQMEKFVEIVNRLQGLIIASRNSISGSPGYTSDIHNYAIYCLLLPPLSIICG